MSPKLARRVLVTSCVVALVALALIVWSILDPRPVPVVLSMSVAQGLGTLSFLGYLAVVVADLWKARVLGGASDEKPRDKGPP